MTVAYWHAVQHDKYDNHKAELVWLVMHGLQDASGMPINWVCFGKLLVISFLRNLRWWSSFWCGTKLSASKADNAQCLLHSAATPTIRVCPNEPNLSLALKLWNARTLFAKISPAPLGQVGDKQSNSALVPDGILRGLEQKSTTM